MIASRMKTLPHGTTSRLSFMSLTNLRPSSHSSLVKLPLHPVHHLLLTLHNHLKRKFCHLLPSIGMSFSSETLSRFRAFLVLTQTGMLVKYQLAS
jgi:hypothetical protein